MPRIRLITDHRNTTGFPTFAMPNVNLCSLLKMAVLLWIAPFRKLKRIMPLIFRSMMQKRRWII